MGRRLEGICTRGVSEDQPRGGPTEPSSDTNGGGPGLDDILDAEAKPRCRLLNERRREWFGVLPLSSEYSAARLERTS